MPRRGRGRGRSAAGGRRRDAAVARGCAAWHVRERAAADGRGEGCHRALGRRRRARGRSRRTCRRAPPSPTAGASARPMRSSRCRRTTPSRRAARSSTSTSTSRRTSPRAKWLQAIEVRPGNRALGASRAASTTRRPPDGPRAGRVLQPESRAQPDAAAPGRRGHRPPRDARPCPSRLLATYAPGPIRRCFVAGTALRLAPGGVLELQMHYTANGTAGTDRTQGRDDLREGAAGRRDPRRRSSSTRQFTIPAGAPTTRSTPRSSSCRTPPSGASFRTRTCAASVELHARAAGRHDETAALGAEVRLQLADLLHVQGAAGGAEGRAHPLLGVVRQLARRTGRIPIRPIDVQMGRSDLGGDAVHRHARQRSRRTMDPDFVAVLTVCSCPCEYRDARPRTSPALLVAAGGCSTAAAQGARPCRHALRRRLALLAPTAARRFRNPPFSSTAIDRRRRSRRAQSRRHQRPRASISPASSSSRRSSTRTVIRVIPTSAAMTTSAANYARENVVDHLRRYAYYGVSATGQPRPRPRRRAVRAARGAGARCRAPADGGRESPGRTPDRSRVLAQTRRMA